MGQITLEEIRKLSVTERLDLLEKIWDSLHDDPEAVPVSGAQRRELDRRLEDLEENPGSVESWEIVRRYVRERKRTPAPSSDDARS